MAHKILGVDLGSWSVKVAVADVGFRKVTVIDVLERRVAEGEEPVEERALRAARELIDEHGLEGESPCFGIGGDAVSLRVLDFGFSNVKRADLEKAVGAELEGELPHDLEDIVFDFEPLPVDALRRSLTHPGEDGAPEEAPPHTAAGTRVLAAASTVDRVAALMSAGAVESLEPRHVIVASTVYPLLAGQLAAAGGNLRREPLLVMDVGHRRTNLCFVWGDRPLYCRTISRGGHHLTEAIAKAWNMDLEKAEAAKHSDGFVASTGEPAPTEAWAHVSAVLQQALVPLVRNIRQTLGACRAATGLVPTHVVLCGGSSRLRGLAAYLGEELELPVAVIGEDDAPLVLGSGGTDRGVLPDTALVAHGLALEGASARPRYDMRKGPLAYKADLSVLRARAGALAAAALLIMAFAAVTAYAALYKLEKEQAVLTERLDRDTRSLFGKPVSPEEVETTLAPKKVKSPFPKLTAWDQLQEMSRVLSPKEQYKVDIAEVDIKPEKIELKGTADTAATIDEIEKRLKEIACFEEVKRGKVFGPDGEKQFTMTITTKCM